MSEDFLSRWSRRKDAARRAGPDPARGPGAAAGPMPDTARHGAADPAPGAGEAALTPDEIAALPRIDELTADSDITGFLRRGVPEGLRNAALRRMWLLDPAIRDFAGHARDYDYDWNGPDAVPGNGALRPGEDVAAMVRQVLGEGEDARAGERRDDAARGLAAAGAPAAEDEAGGAGV